MPPLKAHPTSTTPDQLTNLPHPHTHLRTHSHAAHACSTTTTPTPLYVRQLSEASVPAASSHHVLVL